LGETGKANGVFRAARLSYRQECRHTSRGGAVIVRADEALRRLN
jgi:hypothetical protein